MTISSVFKIKKPNSLKDDKSCKKKGTSLGSKPRMPFYFGAIIPAEIVLTKLAESSQKDKSKLGLCLFISKLYHIPLTPEMEENPVNFWKSNCKAVVPYSDVFLLPVQGGKYILCGRSLKFPENIICSAVGFLDTPPPKDVRTSVFNFLQQNNLRVYEPAVLITDSADDLYTTNFC